MDKLRVMSLFSGIGAFEKALTNLNVEYELVNFCEVDKYAAESYCAIHDEDINKNLGDITTVDIASLSTDIDLLTHGSPCTSFSIAGLQKGGDEGSGTRSSLMWNSVEIIRHTKPKYVVWENVANVLSKAHKHNFDKYLHTLSKLGYTNYHKVLNASDFGIPQNRKRIYVISIRNDIKQSFMFPEPNINSKLLLRDLLEPNNEVDLKYFIIADKVKKLIDKKDTKAPNKEYQAAHSLGSREQDSNDQKENNTTLCTRDYKDCKVVSLPTAPYQSTHQIGSYEHKTYGWKEDVPTLYARDYAGCKIVSLPTEDSESSYKIQKLGNISDNRNREDSENGRIYSPDGIVPTLNTCGGGNLQPKMLFNSSIPNIEEFQYEGYYIRKLTPKEYWRLMDFTDVDFYKAKNRLNEKFYKGKDKSTSQLYKQAGNSIVVKVLEGIFTNLIVNKQPKLKRNSLFR